MEKMDKIQIAILNLTGGLTPELSSYFAKKKLLIIDPEVDKSIHEWTHVLTKDNHDFSSLCEMYSTVEKDIKIISLTPVDDLQHFVASNGKLILDELWMKNSLGSFILDKFLQEYGGIALGDNYPTFKEKGSFIITNPFNTGEYLDRMVQNAYLDGVSGLSIKTYFDHLVMYLTGLKTKGKLGMPIEVMYGFFEDVFGVQMHFFTKDLILEDVTSSLSSSISKKAEKYLLNITVQSSDFFDFTILRDVNKTVITGLWTKDTRIKSDNRGMLFNDLSASAGITSYPTEGITSFQANNPNISDFSDKIILPGVVTEQSVAQVVPGGKAEEEFQTSIKGTKEEAPTSQLISGGKEEEDIIKIIKGKIEEEEKVFKISGSKNFDVEKFAYRVSSGIEEKSTGQDSLKIKSLTSELPEAIKSSFQAFASKLNKTTQDITDEDLKSFNDVEIPQIIKETTKKIDAEFAVQPLEDVLTLKTNDLSVENENLKSKIKTLLTEVKILKESKSQMAEIHSKSVLAASESVDVLKTVANSDTVLKAQIIDRMNKQNSLNEQDTKKLAALLQKESQFLKDSKELELQLKKLQIESVKKDSFVTQEIEKLNRVVKAKELVVTKAKEGFTKIFEQKDNEIRSINEKLAQATKLLGTNQSASQGQQIKELERQVLNHEKMIEIYKAKITTKPVAKTEDDSAKDENKKLQVLNTQMKNQLDVAKKDILKYQERMSNDATSINTLKNDKVKLEQQLKKAAQDAKKDGAANLNSLQQEQEMKKLQLQYDFLDGQVKEGVARQKELEVKLQDALKNQKKDVVSEDTSGKGKTAHLENNVRKLTQDLVESRNQMAEMKKETNKLRQEKTALQNQLDKLKKDTDKAAAQKKPGTPGKAA